MKTFDFRLMKVLEYRRLVEGWAKEAYLDVRAERLEAEVAMLGTKGRQQGLLSEEATTVEHLRSREARYDALEEEFRRQQIVLNILIEEEAQALHEWTLKRQDVAALEKLHDHAFEAWSHEMSKEEQMFLDEWTTSRRAA